MKLHTGIVLKSHMPFKQTVSLLDKSLGHITGILMHDTLSIGTVLMYRLDPTGQRYFVKELELVDMPFILARHDMLFLHHMVELCYTFIPEGVHSERIYDLLRFVFNKSLITKQQKTKILCVLYALLDLYVDDASLYNSYIHELAQVPLDAMIDKDIDTNIEKNISRWLYQCIDMHIQVHQLKTVHFLDEIL